MKTLLKFFWFHFPELHTVVPGEWAGGCVQPGPALAQGGGRPGEFGRGRDQGQGGQHQRQPGLGHGGHQRWRWATIVNDWSISSIKSSIRLLIAPQCNPVFLVLFHEPMMINLPIAGDAQQSQWDVKANQWHPLPAWCWAPTETDGTAIFLEFPLCWTVCPLNNCEFFCRIVKQSIL